MIKKALHPFVDNSSRILILGTMPGDQSIAKQQYYGNKGNRFWKIIFTIFNENYSTIYEDRKALLKKHKIALWNVLASCTREGSSDSKITNETINNFADFHIRYPNIKYVFFESKSAAKFYHKYLERKDDITYCILPSTSGLNAGIPFAQKVEMWQIVAETANNFKLH